MLSVNCIGQRWKGHGPAWHTPLCKPPFCNTVYLKQKVEKAQKGGRLQVVYAAV